MNVRCQLMIRMKPSMCVICLWSPQYEANLSPKMTPYLHIIYFEIILDAIHIYQYTVCAAIYWKIWGKRALTLRQRQRQWHGSRSSCGILVETHRQVVMFLMLPVSWQIMHPKYLKLCWFMQVTGYLWSTGGGRWGTGLGLNNHIPAVAYTGLFFLQKMTTNFDICLFWDISWPLHGG